MGNDPDQSSITRRPRFLRRTIIGAIVGIGLMLLIQMIAPATDHQIANIASMAVGLITGLYVLFQFHRLCSSGGHRLLVPTATALALVTLAICFKIDGVSGELVPQIRFRFSNDRPELVELNRTNAAPSATVVDSDSIDESSTGFLGSRRNGVIFHRSFEVPEEPSDVETLWRHGIGDGWSSFSVLNGLAVTLEQRDDQECVSCYNLTTGDLVWLYQHQARHENPLGGVGPRSTPTIDGDRVYALGATGMLWCFELTSGKPIWTQNLLKLAGWGKTESEAAISWGRSASPLLVDQLCVVPLGGPTQQPQPPRSLIAFDRETGKEVWRVGSDQISYASPNLMTLAGTRQIVSVNEKTVTGHRPDSGQVLWEFDWPGQSNGAANCAMAMFAGENRFVIGKGYGGGSSLIEVASDDAGQFSANELWHSTRVLKTKFTHACIDGDYAYAISNGSLESVQIDEAQQLWTQPRRGRLGQGQILVVEDTIVCQSESGEVVFVDKDPMDYRERIRLPALTSKTWNIPTVAGRHLLVRNDREAICFKLPERIKSATVESDQ